MSKLTDKIRDLARRLLSRNEKPRPAAQEDVDNRIPTEKARQLLAKSQADYNARTADLAKKLATDEITLAQWRGNMVTEIRILHATAAAIGAGGFAYLTSSDIAIVDQRVKEQVAYLDNWTAQMERQPKENRDAGKIASRAEQYHKIAAATAEEVRHQQIGLPKLPVQPKQRSECRNNCKCQWIITTLDADKGDYDCKWKLGDAEHCETCLKRAEVWNPLLVRGGVIVSDIRNPQLYAD